ncbi:MAG: hypothetical protein QW701_06970 [Candidatus Nezhaarchaeales archaeon]
MRSIKVIDGLRTILKAVENFLEDPPKRAIGLLVVIFTCFLLSGGLFSLLEGAPIMISIGGSAKPYYPSLDYQLGAETFAVFLLLIIGVAGIILVHQGAERFPFRGREPFLMALGLILIVASMLLLAWIMYLKLLFYV